MWSSLEAKSGRVIWEDLDLWPKEHLRGVLYAELVQNMDTESLCQFIRPFPKLRSISVSAGPMSEILSDSPSSRQWWSINGSGWLRVVHVQRSGKWLYEGKTWWVQRTLKRSLSDVAKDDLKHHLFKLIYFSYKEMRTRNGNVRWF